MHARALAGFDARCAETTDVGGVGIALGVILTAATAALGIPQAHKLLRLRSSVGISVGTLCLTIMFASFGMGATIVVKWPQVTSCASGLGGCLRHLLDATQQLASALTWLTLLALTVSLPPNNTRRHRLVAAGACFTTVALWTGAVSISNAMPCQPGALRYARVLGWASAASASVQYLPQLRETCKLGDAGSLSFMTYAIQGLGAAAVAVNQIVVLHDPWMVWLPNVVSGATQLVVLGTSIYFFLRRMRGAALSATRPTPPSPPPGDVPDLQFGLGGDMRTSGTSLKGFGTEPLLGEVS